MPISLFLTVSTAIGNKFEFEKTFNLEKIKTSEAIENASLLIDLKMEIKNPEKERAWGYNVFTQYEYDNGRFSFNWNEVFLPHISELKERFVITDLAIVSEFKSGFSWVLYEYLKGHYGNWHVEFSKDELLNLFNVEDKVSYQNNTNILKKGVLDVAVKEINEHTELNVWYTEKKTGNKITGFVLHWSTGDQLAGATPKQVKLLQEIHDEVDKNIVDYLQVRSSQLANEYIVRIKTIYEHVTKGLSVKQADEYIKESLEIYSFLEKLAEQKGRERDTSVYFNWIEEQ